MNKTEMIEAVASETGLAKTEVAKVLNAYTDTIVKTVAEGGVDFSHYFRWLFANFRECSLIS